MENFENLFIVFAAITNYSFFGVMNMGNIELEIKSVERTEGYGMLNVKYRHGDSGPYTKTVIHERQIYESTALMKAVRDKLGEIVIEKVVQRNDKDGNLIGCQVFYGYEGLGPNRHVIPLSVLIPKVYNDEKDPRLARIMECLKGSEKGNKLVEELMRRPELLILALMILLPQFPVFNNLLANVPLLKTLLLNRVGIN
jgi:hypothetical protein